MITAPSGWGSAGVVPAGVIPAGGVSAGVVGGRGSWGGDGDPHQRALDELLDHRSHEHPWAALTGVWVLSRTDSGNFILETTRGTYEALRGGGSRMTYSVVDVTDRDRWPRSSSGEYWPPPGHLLRTWAAQHGGTYAAAGRFPQLGDALLEADLQSATGIVELGTVAALGLTGVDRDDWAAADVAAAVGRVVSDEVVQRAGVVYRGAVDAALSGLPVRCWTRGVMVMGPPQADQGAILDLGAHLSERVGMGLILAEQGLWVPPPVRQYPRVRVMAHNVARGGGGTADTGLNSTPDTALNGVADTGLNGVAGSGC